MINPTTSPTNLKAYIVDFSRRDLDHPNPETISSLAKDLLKKFILPIMETDHTLLSLNLDANEYWLVRYQIERINTLFNTYTHQDLHINKEDYTIFCDKLNGYISKKLGSPHL